MPNTQDHIHVEIFTNTKRIQTQSKYDMKRPREMSNTQDMHVEAYTRKNTSGRKYKYKYKYRTCIVDVF